MTLPLTAAFLLLLRRQWFWSGVLMVVAGAFKQVAAVGGAASAGRGCCCSSRRRSRIRAAVRFGAGIADRPRRRRRSCSRSPDRSQASGAGRSQTLVGLRGGQLDAGDPAGSFAETASSRSSLERDRPLGRGRCSLAARWRSLVAGRDAGGGVACRVARGVAGRRPLVVALLHPGHGAARAARRARDRSSARYADAALDRRVAIVRRDRARGLVDDASTFVPTRSRTTGARPSRSTSWSPATSATHTSPGDRVFVWGDWPALYVESDRLHGEPVPGLPPRIRTAARVCRPTTGTPRPTSGPSCSQTSSAIRRRSSSTRPRQDWSDFSHYPMSDYPGAGPARGRPLPPGGDGRRGRHLRARLLGERRESR